MNDGIEFALVEVERLRAHEEVIPREVAQLARAIRGRRVVIEPILVARGSDVILNGHHRFAALRALGAVRIPAWIVDYANAGIVLDRWGAGPPLDKAEVIRRARQGELFPPKTTKHRLTFALPSRPTPLTDLLPSSASNPRSAVRVPSR